MRNLIFVGIAIAAASAAGWFQIQRDGDTTRIDINRAEIRSDARRAIDRGRQILDRTAGDQKQSAPTSAGPQTYAPQYRDQRPLDPGGSFSPTGYENSNYTGSNYYPNYGTQRPSTYQPPASYEPPATYDPRR